MRDSIFLLVLAGMSVALFVACTDESGDPPTQVDVEAAAQTAVANALPSATSTALPTPPSIVVTATPSPTPTPGIPTPLPIRTLPPTVTPTSVVTEFGGNSAEYRPQVAPTPIPPPVASFNGDVLSGQVPLDVTFTASIDGTVNSYEWDFGDGETSSETAPTHRYTVAGDHTVSLTVSGSSGTDTKVSNDYVSARPGPAVGLAIGPESPTLSPQEVIQLKAFAVDGFGNELDGAVTFTVDDRAGSVTEDGVFTAVTVAGTYEQAISATTTGPSAELNATFDVVVVPGPLQTLSVAPRDLTVSVDEFVQFELAVQDGFGNDITEYATAWSVDSSAGSVDDAGGYTSAKKMGTFPGGISVDVVKGSTRKTVTIDIVVEPGPLALVSVEPETAYVAFTGSRQFTAKATDEFGNELPGLELAWSTTGGSITGDGEFSSNSVVGTHEISASAIAGVGVSRSATVEVLPSTAFIVNTTEDTRDTSPGNGRCQDNTGGCSLRAAVMESNARGGSRVEANAILVPPGTYILTRIGYGDDLGGLGDLDIRAGLSIYGFGTGLSIIDGNATDRVLEIFTGTPVQIVGVTIRNGAIKSDQAGGGIINHGSLTLIDTAITGNSSPEGRGGGIHNGGTLTIIDSVISDNFSGKLGSAIISYQATTVRITRSTISGNRTPSEGTIFNFRGTVIIDDSTISQNDAWAGVLYNGGGTFRVANSTIYNPASTPAFAYGDQTFEFVNSIISSGSSPGCVGEGFVSLGHNIASDFSCGLSDDTDQPGTDAMLGPLQDNGGPTLTHALLPGSPAIDAGEDGGAPLTDQRGKPRISGSAIDIGSFEFQ